MREEEAEEKALAEENENGGVSARKTRAATFVNRNLSIPHSLKVIEDPFVVAAGMCVLFGFLFAFLAVFFFFFFFVFFNGASNRLCI